MSLLISRVDMTARIREQMKGRWREWNWWKDQYEDPPHLPHLLGGSYTRFTPVRLQRFLGWSETDGHLRKARLYDCRAFARALWKDCDDYGALDWLGLEYPFAFGIVAGGLSEAHMYNWAMMEDDQILFVEPQEDWILTPSDDPILRPAHFNIEVFLG